MVESMRLHVNACIYIVHMHLKCLFYAFVRIFTYDVMGMMIKFKSNPLQDLSFQNH